MSGVRNYYAPCPWCRRERTPVTMSLTFGLHRDTVRGAAVCANAGRPVPLSTVADAKANAPGVVVGAAGRARIAS